MLFKNTYYLWGLLLLLLFTFLFLLLRRWKKKAYERFGQSSVVERLMPERSDTGQWLKFIVLMLALAIIILVIARPQTGSKLEKTKHKGVELMILLDVSNSMLAEDIKPDRLGRAKLAIIKLLDKLEDDRIGLIVFAGKPYCQLPITNDYGAAKLFLSTVSTDMIPTQGTAIGAAIDMALKSFNFNDKKKDKAIIIISDGENHEDDAVESTKIAYEKGVYVHTIGMGLAEGAPIPIYKNGVASGFKQDGDGNTIMTKLNEPMLQEIAAAGHGTYVRASNSDVGLDKIMAEIDKMEKKETEAKVYSDYEEQYQFFVLLALFFLILEIIIFEKKSSWFTKMNFFGESKGRMFRKKDI